MNIKLLSLLTILVPAVASAAAVVPDVKPSGRIFVAGFVDESKSVDDSVLQLFLEVVRDGARQNATGYTLMDRENAEVILKDFGLNLEECLSNGRKDCELKFGQRIKADFVVSERIVRLADGTWRVKLTLLDVGKGAQISAIERSAPDLSRVEDVLKAAVPDLFVDFLVADNQGDAAAGATGSVLIKTEPPELDVYVDGKVVGSSPLLLDRLKAGVHRIRARGNIGGREYTDREELTIEVVEGGVLNVEIRAIEAGVIKKQKAAASAERSRVLKEKVAFLWNVTLLDMGPDIGMSGPYDVPGRWTAGVWFMPSVSFGITVVDRWRLYARAETGAVAMVSDLRTMSALIAGVGIGTGVVLGSRKNYFLDVQVGYENVAAGGGYCEAEIEDYDFSYPNSREDCEDAGEYWVQIPEHGINAGLIFGWRAHGFKTKPYTNVGAGFGYHSNTQSFTLSFLVGFGH